MTAMKLDSLIGNVIERPNRGTAGVVIMKFPCGDGAILANSALDFDDAGRAKVSPGEFLFARPNNLNGLTGRLGEPGGFQWRFRRMLAAITGAHIRSNNANLVLGHF